MKLRRDDRVFRALADPRRRRMLDLLRERPGLSATELAERFPFSRVAVVKHLDVLERGGLVSRRRRGKSVALYVDDAPVQDVLSRRLEACAPLWAHRLADLKDRLEKESPRMPSPESRVYVVYIRTTKEALWDAITRPEMTRRYFFSTDLRSTLKPGAPIEYVLKDPAGKEHVPVVGEVLEVVPHRRLVHTFRFPAMPDAPTRVAYDLEPAGAGTMKLTVTHDGFEGETKTWREVGGGWPQVVSALKTLLETGEDLAID
jgi:uncharacterized protein YndB with AHSA1/START domain/DNA-binding transcriptional ArsR family regulator